MSFISKNFNETSNKHKNLLKLFVNSGGNTYILFLLSIITVSLAAKEKIDNILKISKML